MKPIMFKKGGICERILRIAQEAKEGGRFLDYVELSLAEYNGLREELGTPPDVPLCQLRGVFVVLKAAGIVTPKKSLLEVVKH